MKKIETLDDLIEEETKDFAGQIDDTSINELTKEIFYHQYGDLVIEPIKDYINSNFLWFIESSSQLTGGPIKWQSSQVRLKHMNTNMYLQYITISDMQSLSSDDEYYLNENYIFTMTNNPHATGTLFNIKEVNDSGKYIRNGRALHLNCQGVSIERGDVLNDNSYMIKGNKEKSSALSLIVNRFVSVNDEVLENAE
jgi:hypothetical protein